jgi:hypothetical protein
MSNNENAHKSASIKIKNCKNDYNVIWTFALYFLIDSSQYTRQFNINNWNNYYIYQHYIDLLVLHIFLLNKFNKTIQRLTILYYARIRDVLA